jgi:hypothetical protein
VARSRLTPSAAVLVAAMSGFVAGTALLPDEVRISASGDWRAVSEGLRRWSDRVTVVAGDRFLVHAHDLPARATDLRIRLQANPGAAPVRLQAWTGGSQTWAGTLPASPQWLTFPISSRDVDVLLTADSVAPRARARVMVDAIAVRFEAAAMVRAARLVPPLVGAIVCAVLWARGRRATALAWSVFLALVTAVAAACTVEPAALLRWDPATRETARVLALAALWALALAEPPSRALAAAAIAGTVALVYAPTVGFGLLSDDFLWARPWTARELAGAFAGPEDPLGRTTGTYRPIADVTRALDHALWGVGAAGAHLTNLVLLGVAGALAAALGRRLGLTPRAALALAVTWVAHPLSVASAAWVSQRTDTLAAIFFLAALVVFLAPRLDGKRAAAAAALAVLALASKEIAVTLPLAAWVADRVAGPGEDRERRRTVLRLLVLLVLAYVALWAGLFPEKMLRGETQRGAWLGFDARQPGDGMRLLPLLYATVFLPAGYEHWFRTTLREWPLGHLALAVALAGLVLVGVRRAWPGPSARVAAFGLAWPLLVIGPILGARPDLYRLGLFPALAFGLVLGAALLPMERRAPWLPSMAIALAAALLLPVTVETVGAWRPDGFFAARAIEWSRRHADWQAELTPEARALFLAQVEREAHAQRLLEPGESP